MDPIVKLMLLSVLLISLLSLVGWVLWRLYQDEQHRLAQYEKEERQLRGWVAGFLRVPPSAVTDDTIIDGEIYHIPTLISHITGRDFNLPLGSTYRDLKWAVFWTNERR